MLSSLTRCGTAARPLSHLQRLNIARRWLAALTLGLACAPFAAAQVRTAGSCESLPGGVIEVEGTGGSGAQPTGYATLGAAFAAINTGVHTGTIAIDVCGDTNEGAATATLNASGSGSASYTSIAISPAGGAARTISGATTAGSPMIDFNGADNVTVDGLNVGGNALTISNTTVSATSGTSTLRFIGGATGNTITRSNLQGSVANSVATNGAVVFFSTDTVTANGNDTNTISQNNIGPAGANLPTKGVLCNGSASTTAIGNSGNVIDNNNIFDYFGAAVTSAGVAANGGCNGNSITNNRFYQTGTRTWTTGALHVAIDIGNTTATSGAQGFTITGNTIGYASSSQTGTYTLTGAGTGAKFIGIRFNGIVSGTSSNINNNTVAAVSLTGVTGSGTTTASPFTAILLQEGNLISNGNTIGSQSATGSLTFSTTTTSSTDVYGIHNFTSNAWTSNNNTVGGISVTNLAASGTILVYGMRAFTASTVTWSASGNVVGGSVADSISLNATGASSQVVGMFTNNAPTVLSGNTIRNLTSNIGTGTTSSASVIGINLSSTTPNQTVSGNTIHSLRNTNPAAATIVTGIQFTGSTANVVERNLIYGLSSATNSASAEINGIRVAGGTTIYRNNMIALGAGVTNAIGAAASNSGTTGINGINEFLGTNSFFHNSVYIGGMASAGTGASYAFNGTQTVNTRSFRNNIFFNARTNGGASGKHYAVKINVTTANPGGLTLNNNLYFANGSGGVFGFFNSADVADLAAWRTAVGQDGASFEGNPQFNDPTNAAPDLHLHPTNATIAEGNGSDVGVVNDFDGQTRATLTPVDIGADAGNFNGFDLAPPVIAYTPLGNTTSTANRTFSATITDAGSGVPGSGIGLPVIYYRKGTSGAFASAQATSGGGGSYGFTIDYALIAGVAVGDTIQYYVVAQDSAATPNVGANPSTGASGFSANPPAAATPPTAPNSYLIAAPLSGTRTVCASGCDYPTLTGAGGAFAALNAGVLTGNVDLQVAGDLVAGEDGSNPLNAPTEQPAGSNFSIRIYPTGSARAITGAFNGALVRIAGASRVVIDGSLGGAGTDRSLTISNTSVTSPSVVLFGSLGTTPISSNTLKNCVIINGVNTSSAVVISDAATLGSAGQFSNIAIQNNDIRRAFVGVFATGGTTPQGGSGLTYTQNTINSSGANAVRSVGLYLQGVNGATVTQNTVGNVDKINDENDVGIWLASGTINATVSGNTVAGLGYTGTGAFAPIGINITSGLAATGHVIAGNAVSDISTSGGTSVRGLVVSGATSDLVIEKNNVQGVINGNTGTFGAYGMDISGGNNVVVRNNFVSNVSFNMTGGSAFSTTFGVFGIRIGAGTGHRIYANSVNLYGLLPGTAATNLLTAAFGLVSTTSTGVDVRDNIFANNISGGTTGIAHVAAYLPSGGTSAMNLTWNNNAYFSGTDAARQGVGQAGTTPGTNFLPTLPNLLGYSSTLSPAGTNDNASLASTAAVPFLTANDLHLTAGSPLNTAGVPLPGVTTDIDNDARSASTPSIGADEIPPAQADLAIVKNDGVASATPGMSTTYTIQVDNLAGPAPTTATVNDTFPAILSCNWSCSVSGGASCGAGGPGNINDAVNLPVGGVVVYTAVCAIAPSAPAGNLINTATVTNTGGTVDPNLANNSSTDDDVLTPSANLGITKTNGVTTSTPGLPTTYTIVASNAGPSNSPLSTVVDTFPPALTGCNWTCVGSGTTCGAGAPGNINDTISLPVGASATYTATCTIAPAATNTLANTASISGSVSDPNNGNNSATDSDTLVQNADLSITKTDGVTTATPGGSVTYSITAANAGPSGNIAATVIDPFPAALTCNWTCSATPGSTCPGSGSGNIGVAVSLAFGGAVNFVASCNISPSATGSLVNTATVSPAAIDPVPGNNSATDTDTLTPQADLSITKTNGASSVTAGGSTTYTIVASNNGPSNTSATVADTFPAALTCTWTCVGAGGGTCTAGPVAGNMNDAVTLPSGGSTTYTASCAISGSASGTISNTATVVGAATDPNPGNNSATDSDPVTVCPSTVVINGNDSGAGSLRQVIADACAGSTITFDPGVSIVNLTSAELLINKNLVIDGGTAVTVQRSSAGGTPNFRIFNVSAGTTATLRSLTVRNGNHPSQAGGIQNSGDLTLDRVTVDSNFAPQGGGVQNDALMTIIDSAIVFNSVGTGYGGGLIAGGARTTLSNTTIANNQGGSDSGGIAASGLVTLDHCTITGNSVTSAGSGIVVNTANVVLRNTIVSGNTGGTQIEGSVDASSRNNLVGSVGSGGLVNGVNGNLVGVSALTAVLSNYGGPTPTLALLPGSPAIDAGAASEMQQLTVSGPPGGFTLSFQGQTTSGLASSATAAQVQAALEALSTIGAGNVVVSAVGNVYTMRFAGALGSANQPAITGVGLGGAIVALTTLFDGGAPATDQRGIARPQQTAVDIGAYESRGFTLAITGGNNQSTGIGTAFASPLVVSVSPLAAGEPVNGGRVSFTPPGAGASASLSPNSATISAGSASTTATANATIGGPYTVTAAANGAVSANFSLTNVSLATTTTITSDAPDPSVVGQPYTVDVQVSSATQSPLGTVSISDGSGATCGPLTLIAGSAPNSTASCSLTSTTAGAKTLTATYTPASGLFQASSGNAGHQVNPAATTISVSGPARSRVNQPTAFSFALAVSSPGAGTPTGTVTLSSGAASCTATLPATSCNLSFNPLGPRTVSASYAGDGNFAASASSGAGNAQTLVYASADIAVTKSDGQATYEPGDLIVYSVLVRNLGPDAAANIRVTDLVPAGLASVAWSCDASGGAVCPVAGGSGNLDVVIATLPSGGLLGFTFYGTVGGSPAQIANTAAIVLPADTTIEDPVPGNNSATDIDLLEFVFRDGFEDPPVFAATGSLRLPALQLRPLLGEVAQLVYTLKDADGVAARVYARVWEGEIQFALASRSGGGLQLGAWRSYAGEPVLSWTARPAGARWQVQTVDLR